MITRAKYIGNSGCSAGQCLRRAEDAYEHPCPGLRCFGCPHCFISISDCSIFIILLLCHFEQSAQHRQRPLVIMSQYPPEVRTADLSYLWNCCSLGDRPTKPSTDATTTDARHTTFPRHPTTTSLTIPTHHRRPSRHCILHPMKRHMARTQLLSRLIRTRLPHSRATWHPHPLRVYTTSMAPLLRAQSSRCPRSNALPSSCTRSHHLRATTC